MEVQGAGQPLELPRRLLRRPAPGLPGAVVAAAAAFGPTLDMQVLSSFKNICQDSRLWHFCQLGVAQMGCDLARVVDPGPAEKSGAEDWQCPLLCHSDFDFSSAGLQRSVLLFTTLPALMTSPSPSPPAWSKTVARASSRILSQRGPGWLCLFPVWKALPGKRFSQHL
ncbi:uncharacterized protein LOC128930962 isoform X3 [Callithrix jacchus]